jgi:hypothetical protein
MPYGDMWWARNVTSSLLPPGASSSPTPQGFRFVGSGSTSVSPFNLFDPEPHPPWRFFWTADYFLDPARMPATGEPFIAMPKIALGGNLILFDGPPQNQTGGTRWSVSLSQWLSWNDELITSSSISYMFGYTYGGQVLSGKRTLTPQPRDFAPLFFNLDRSRTLLIRLDISLDWEAWNGGGIVFGPFDVSIPSWRVYALD